MKTRNKALVLTLCAVLLVVATVMGTLAYLTAETQKITNTFTVGQVKIDLKETTTAYKMVPGCEISKDPKVIVKAGSEACWLFVKVEKTNDVDSYLNYSIATGWTQLEKDGNKVDGVYYRDVASNAAEQQFAVLTDNKVTVKDTVTSDMMKTAETNAPTLSFTAYAFQKANGNGTFTVNEAWEKLTATPVTP